MRNLVFLAFIAVVLFAIVGWFMDWYSFPVVKTDQGKVNVQLQFDKDKISQDLEKGKNKFGNTVDQFRKDSAVKPTETSPTSKQTLPWFN